MAASFVRFIVSIKLEDLLPAQEVASKLNVHPRTLWRWRNEGVGPSYVAVGRQIYYTRESIAVWLRSQEVTPCREK